jgi:hypothetical protein
MVWISSVKLQFCNVAGGQRACVPLKYEGVQIWSSPITELSIFFVFVVKRSDKYKRKGERKSEGTERNIT